jgi:hypothetical protein
MAAAIGSLLFSNQSRCGIHRKFTDAVYDQQHAGQQGMGFLEAGRQLSDMIWVWAGPSR